MQPSVLHVVPAFSRGGAGRALLTAMASRNGRSDCRDRVVSLASADAFMVGAAARQGVEVFVEPAAEDLVDLVAETDVLQLHFWNTPEVYSFLAMELPPSRTVIWCHVMGDSAPQVFSPALLEHADSIVATNPRSAELILTMSAEREGTTPAVRTIPGIPGWGRLQGLKATPHATYNVGYLGTVDPVKMHPDFLSLCQRVDVRDARFIVCGDGRRWEDLSRAAASGPMSERLQLRGYVEDIESLIPEFDVLGYPLAPGNYSTSDLALTEVMYAEVPPVVLPHGGVRDMVEHLHTGIVAADEDDYVRWIEILHERPELRRRLGQAAGRSARSRWDPAHVGRQWATLYEDLARQERSSPPPIVAPVEPGAPAAGVGARMFVLSLGSHARDFRLSLDGGDLGATLAAEQRIARAGPGLASPDGGGVLHWRIAHPDDGDLRFWSGLIFRRQGRHVLAIAELTAALRRGCDHWRVAWHLSRSAEAVGLVEAPLGVSEMIPADLPSWAHPLLELGQPAP